MLVNIFFHPLNFATLTFFYVKDLKKESASNRVFADRDGF